MPFSHNRLKTTTGIYRYTAVSRANKYTLSYRFLNGNVHGCVFTKNRTVSLKAAYSVTMNIFYFLFKSFVKVELSYVFTIKMYSTAENCMER